MVVALVCSHKQQPRLRNCAELNISLGSWPYYKEDAMTFASWGIDFVKMDWCGHPGGHQAEGRPVIGILDLNLELYGLMRDALNATGRPILFSICEWGLYNVWEWGMRS